MEREERLKCEKGEGDERDRANALTGGAGEGGVHSHSDDCMGCCGVSVRQRMDRAIR
jgi:hypothetical protein